MTWFLAGLSRRFGVAFLGALCACALAQASTSTASKHLRRKHPKSGGAIVLSNDDLPRNGHHYVMVPAPVPAVAPAQDNAGVPPPVPNPNDNAAALQPATPAPSNN